MQVRPHCWHALLVPGLLLGALALQLVLGALTHDAMHAEHDDTTCIACVAAHADAPPAAFRGVAAPCEHCDIAPVAPAEQLPAHVAIELPPVRGPPA